MYFRDIIGQDSITALLRSAVAEGRIPHAQLICGGEGCPSCKHSGWLELCPCGMIHPEVLKAGGIDPEEYIGFAFGLGLTRLAMMKYKVKDIRDLNSGNLKTLDQFTFDE